MILERYVLIFDYRIRLCWNSIIRFIIRRISILNDNLRILILLSRSHTCIC
ncbi:hypothetical protein Hanom_Chr04g00371891 [Helianthus anomalus]